MMLIDGKDRTYFIDRDNCVFQVDNITFLHRKMPNKHIASTLLDGVSLGVLTGDWEFISTKFGSVRVHRLVVASRRLYAFIYHLSVCFALLQEDNFVALPKTKE